MTMKITRYKKASGIGSKVATFSLQVEKWGNFFINNMSLWHKNGARWVSFPSYEYEKEGQKKYAPYCGFCEEETKDNFQKQILRALDDYCMANKGIDP